MLTANYQPKKSLGQYFLFDEKVLNKIVDATEVSRRDVVLEIGPGTGSLTQKLLIRARKVIAVEIDQNLVQKLKSRFRDYRNLEVIKQDIIEFADHELESKDYKKDYKLVGNIPYYISGKILRKFTSQIKNRPALIVLLVQKEVGERVCARPGKMSILSVAVQVFGQPEIIKYVPREKFEPPPEVDSAILKITMFERSLLAQKLGWFGRRGRPVISPEEMDKQEEEFFRLVKTGFSARRKQLHNNLQSGYHFAQEEVATWLSHAEIKPRVRAQELRVYDWIKLLEMKPNF